MKWKNKNVGYIFLGFLGGILGGLFCMCMKHANNIGTLADWLSAGGTIAAVLVALRPQIKAMFGSDLLFQIELDPSSDNCKLNIFNLSDVNEIVDIGYMTSQIKVLNYIEKDSSEARYETSDFNKQLNPVLIKASDGFKSYINIGNYEVPKNKIYAYIIKVKLTTRRNSDNYLFYRIIIRYGNKQEVFKENPEKNVSEEKMKSDIEEELNSIPDYVREKLNIRSLNC